MIFITIRERKNLRIYQTKRIVCVCFCAFFCVTIFCRFAVNSVCWSKFHLAKKHLWKQKMPLYLHSKAKKTQTHNKSTHFFMSSILTFPTTTRRKKWSTKRKRKRKRTAKSIWHTREGRTKFALMKTNEQTYMAKSPRPSEVLLATFHAHF